MTKSRNKATRLKIPRYNRLRGSSQPEKYLYKNMTVERRVYSYGGSKGVLVKWIHADFRMDPQQAVGANYFLFWDSSLAFNSPLIVTNGGLVVLDNFVK